MISISGINYQKELESLPYFNKIQAAMLIGKKGRNLDKKLAQLKKIGYLLSFKKGLYVTSGFYESSQGSTYAEYMANVLRGPSYISLEYVLAKEGLIPEAVYAITSITVKSSRVYANFLGSYVYRNVKKELFCGYKSVAWGTKTIFVATRAKALFDVLYLKKTSDIQGEGLSDLRINWNSWRKDDTNEFKQYVSLACSEKMRSAAEQIKNHTYVS